MRNDQKEAIKIIMNLYNKEYISDEQYFLLLDFIINDTRSEIKISEFPWNVPKSPDYPPITLMYGCPTEGVIYDSATTYNKIEKEKQQ